MERLRRIRLTARNSVKCQYVSFGSFFPGDNCVNVVGNDLRRLFELGSNAVVIDVNHSDDPSSYPANDLQPKSAITFRQTAAHSV